MAASKGQKYSAAVLRNKGVPVELAKVAREQAQLPANLTPEVIAAAGAEVPQGKPTIVRDSNGKPVMETVYISFDVNGIVDLEEHFGGLEAWKNAMEKSAVTATRATLAIALDRDKQEVGVAMVTDRIPEYSAAVGVAWGMANGLDPRKAAEMLTQAGDATRKALDAMEAEMDDATNSSDDDGIKLVAVEEKTG